MSLKTAQLFLVSLPLVLAAGWGGFQAVCDSGNPNAMFGRLGPPSAPVFLPEHGHRGISAFGHNFWRQKS